MQNNRRWSSVGVAVVSLALLGCGSPPAEITGGAPMAEVASEAAHDTALTFRANSPVRESERAEERVANQDALMTSQAEAWDEWYDAVRDLPDTSARLQAIELWAQQPRDMRDQLASALLDEDDAVRERAEALYDQQLEWEGIEPERDSVQMNLADEE